MSFFVVLVLVVLGLKSAHASPPAPPLALGMYSMYLFIFKNRTEMRKKERKEYVCR